MIDAVRSVRPAQRVEAAFLAEKTYFESLVRLEEFGDFDSETNQKMAADAAAAELAYRYA